MKASTAILGTKHPPQIDYSRIFNHINEALIVTDHSRRIMAVNKAASRMTGFSKKRLLQMRIDELTVHHVRRQVSKKFQQAVDEGSSSWSAEVERNRGGKWLGEFHAVALGDDQVVTTIHDISNYISTEEELKQTVETYASLVQLCHAAVVSADENGRILSWNPAAVQLFGHTEKEAIGRPVTMMISQIYRRKHLAKFKQHVESSLDESFRRSLESVAVHKDGTEFAVEANLAVESRDHEKVFIAVVRDISKYREVVERLNDALQQLRFHVERMPLAYIVWDTNFRAVEWNPAAEKIFGYAKSEALGRTAKELIVPPDAHRTINEIWAALLKGDTASHAINANVRADGSKLTCEWFNTPLRDSEGHIQGVASMAMDLSEQEDLQAQLRNTQKMESLGVLASGVAHDFNSSLTVILGNTALIKSTKTLPPKVHGYLRAVEEAGFRAKNFIDHLLAYARTGHHKPQPTNLNAVVESAISLVRSSIDKRHELELHLAKKLPTILTDYSQVEQIILNLCLNADQALDREGVLSISTRSIRLSAARARMCVPDIPKPGRYVELKVSDDGCGMDEDVIRCIFDPFFTTKAEGHGLGLAAVLGILRQHDAVAYVDSTVGKGTKMHIYFPVHEN